MISKPRYLVAAIVAASLFTAAAIGACRQPGAAPATVASDELVLKAYQVPTPYGPELAGIVRSLLQRGAEKPAGNVAISPSGELLVAAPGAFHPGIAQFLSGLSKATPAPPPTIRIDYWAVVGKRSAKPEADPALAEIGSVVDALTKAQGAFALDLLEKVSVSSLSGERAQQEGARATVSQTATSYADSIIADLDLYVMGSNTLRTRVRIPLNKTIVLGQADFSTKSQTVMAMEQGGKTNAPPAEMALFYVIRAQVVAF